MHEETRNTGAAEDWYERIHDESGKIIPEQAAFEVVELQFPDATPDEKYRLALADTLIRSMMPELDGNPSKIAALAAQQRNSNSNGDRPRFY